MPERTTIQINGVQLEFPSPPDLFDIELAYIPFVLEKHEGNKRAASEELGISRKTLYERLKIIDRMQRRREAR